MPRTARQPWRTSCKVMEAVNHRFIITVTKFHTSSTSPMLHSYLPPLGSRTTNYQVASYTSRPSPNAACTSSTNHCQFEGSIVTISVDSIVSSCLSSPVTTSSLCGDFLSSGHLVFFADASASISSPASASASTSASAFRAFSTHHLRCYALII